MAGIQPKIIRHAKKQENKTHNDETINKLKQPRTDTDARIGRERH